MSYRRKYQNKKKSYSEDIQLISYVKEVNEFGEIREDKELKRLVYARQTNLSRQDFYQSRIAGLKPTLSFEIKSIEYAGEDKLEYNNKRYNIVKTYKIGQDIELTCEKVSYDKSN